MSANGLRWIALSFALLSGVNCRAFQPATSGLYAAQPATPERCIALDDRNSTYTMVGAGSAILSGTSGLTTVATDSSGARIALALSSLVFGALAVGMQTGARKSAEQYIAEGCGRE